MKAKSFFRFIGSGAALVSENRFHSSIVFSIGSYRLLVDTGDGISFALNQLDIPANSIDGIIITHLHPDHFSGFPSLLNQMKMTGREKDIDVFIDENDLKFLNRLLEHSYIFPERLGFKLIENPIYHNQHLTITDDFSILIKKNSHLDKKHQIETCEFLNYNCFSLLMYLDDSLIQYTSDIGSIDDIMIFEDKRPDILITEISHIEIADIENFVKNGEITRLFGTHIGSSDMEKIKSLENCCKKYKIVFYEARDGDIYYPDDIIKG